MAKDVSLGFSSQALGVTDFEGKKKLMIANPSGLTDQGKVLGLTAGDILIKINNDTVPDLGPELSPFFVKHKSNLKEGAILSYTVIRKSESGEQVQLELSSKVEAVEVKQKHVLTFTESGTPQQLALRKAWLSAN